MSGGGATAVPRRLVVARLGAAHGVRGEVKITAFGDDPQALVGYGPLTTTDGRTFRVLSLKTIGARLVARLAGVGDRTSAEALSGIDLHVDRDRLPPPEDDDTFYHADLIGLPVETTDGRAIGSVVAVPDYGAGELLEIAPLRGATVLLPFTRAVVPVIDIAGRRIVVDLPPGLLDADDEPDGEAAESGAALPRAEGAGPTDRP